MSTDYYASCSTCRRAAHLFVRFTSGPVFGNGSKDEAGRRAAAEWLLEHAGEGHVVFVVDGEAVPDDFKIDKLDRSELAHQVREQLAAPLVVHLLEHGLPLCGFSKLPPAAWPPGHKWIGREVGPDCADVAAEIVNCETCRNMLDVEETTRER